MRAIIHIGVEKTGTTAIQEFLQINRTPLREQGVALLDHAGHLNNWKFATYAMNPKKVDDLVKREGIESEADRQHWREQFEVDLQAKLSALDQNVNSLLISSEHLHSRLPTTEEVERVHSLLSNYFSEFKIVVYLRRQDQLALSLFSTYYKAGGTDSLVDQLAQQSIFDSEYYDFSRVLNKWSDVFGADAIVPRVFDRAAFVNQSLIDDFMFACGLSSIENQQGKAESRNESLSKEALEALRIFNTYFPADDNELNAKNNSSLRVNFVKTLESNLSGVPQIVDKATAERFMENFSASNKEVAQKWFNRESLFDEDYSVYEDSDVNRFEMSDVLNTVIQFFKENDLRYFSNLSNLDNSKNRADLLRDLAISVEKENPYLACFLMQEARQHRPDDPVIEGKLADYKSLGVDA